MAAPLRIAVLPGDGIGPEVTREAVRVLRAVCPDLSLELREGAIGWAAASHSGDALPAETLALIETADAILFGAVGGPEYEEWKRRSGQASPLLRLRSGLGLYANHRPVVMFPELENASTLKPEVVRGLDILILRELNGDIYFGEPRGEVRGAEGREAFNTMRYTEAQIRRIAEAGFHAARRRRGRLCSVDKANVLETMRLWCDVVTEVGRDFPDVELQHMYVDAAAMRLMRAPKSFDVVVTGNMFGDILSDQAAMLTGSLGMLPSASIGEGDRGLYEPIHGSAPDIAGQDIANPIGAILSAALMLRLTFGLEAHARRIEAGVRQALSRGLRTADIAEPGATLVGTRAMGDAIVAAIEQGDGTP